MKWTGGLLVGFAGLVSSVPEYLLTLFWCAVLITLLDTLTGCVCAWCEGKLRSRNVVSGFLVKWVQFGALCGVFGVFAAVSKYLPVMAVPLLIIIWVETISNVENIYKMERFGGVEFPEWARTLIARLAKGLQVAAETQTEQFAQRTEGGLSVRSTPEHHHENR